MGKIFIPKTCRVGFQERDDTFTKRLAYVIYYDAKGGLRKEQSWTSWCHTPGGTRHHGGKRLTVDVTPYDFENTPTSGFVLNKGHTRHPWSSFGERRTVIRIYDPRGIEFEITPENLVGILMHTDCSRREIQGNLVYAWCGAELMLLPCSSEEYASALNYTALQSIRVSAKDLREGFTYVTKRETTLVYLGRHMWYETGNPYDDDPKRVGSKQHIFCDLDGKNVKPVKSVSSTISKQVSDGCHDKYADWVDAYLKSPESSKIVGFERVAIPDSEWEKDWYSEGYHGPSIGAVTDLDGRLVSVTISRHMPSSLYEWHSVDRTRADRPLGPPKLAYRRYHVIQADGSACCSGTSYGATNVITDKSKFFRLLAVFENGMKQEWR